MRVDVSALLGTMAELSLDRLDRLAPGCSLAGHRVTTNRVMAQWSEPQHQGFVVLASYEFRRSLFGAALNRSIDDELRGYVPNPAPRKCVDFREPQAEP